MCPGPPGLGHTDVVDPVTLLQLLLLALGGVLTIGGATLLVLAFRRGQTGDQDTERRLFRYSVAALATGSLCFLVTVLVTV